ncbi:MAG: ATP-binding cassette domain-containing protein [Alkalibacterium sp.]|nr:ATP-binding cassette domain-containing protein [Alkalibacterium sp.]
MKIEMRDIVKSFGTNKVLLGVNLDIHSGEVHALMGENGAGKSTLMNILTGLHRCDSGTIIINGEERTFENPKRAEEGISFITPGNDHMAGFNGIGKLVYGTRSPAGAE